MDPNLSAQLLICRVTGVSPGSYLDGFAVYQDLAWIIHDFAGEKRKGALKD